MLSILNKVSEKLIEKYTLIRDLKEKGEFTLYVSGIEKQHFQTMKRANIQGPKARGKLGTRDQSKVASVAAIEWPRGRAVEQGAGGGSRWEADYARCVMVDYCNVAGFYSERNVVLSIRVILSDFHLKKHHFSHRVGNSWGIEREWHNQIVMPFNKGDL